MKAIIFFAAFALSMSVGASSLSSLVSVAVSCDVTATRVANTIGGFNAIMCANTSTDVVHFGGSTVTAANGMPVCADTALCIGPVLALDTVQGELYCIAAAPTEIRCITGK
jgi:hypothetical protein